MKYLKGMDVCACKDDTGNSTCVCTYTLEYGHKAAICNFLPCIWVQNNMSFVNTVNKNVLCLHIFQIQ